MQNAVGASTWPVMGAIKWDRTYHAMVATPLRVRDILLGNLALVPLGSL
jgi:lipooligosaccharide transport system permease protein